MFLTDDDMKIQALLSRNAYQLRNLLNINYEVEAYNQANYMEYYIATALDELLKLFTSMIRWEDDFKGGFDKEIEKTLIGNLIIQGLDNEINMYYRKLLEALINLLLWSELRDEKYVQYYYLIKSYNLIKSKNRDLKDFYGIESEKSKINLNNIKSKLVIAFDEIEESKCFFIDQESYTTKIKSHNLRLKESNIKVKLMKALRNANESDKLLLGFSYDRYSYSSSKIHFNSTISNHNSDLLASSLRFMMLIANRIILTSAQILDIQDLEEFKNADELYSNLCSSVGWFTPLTKDIYEIDDYVYTLDGLLGRITEKITSNFGYKSYKILFLGNDYGLIEDYLPAHEFRRIQPKEELYNIVFRVAPIMKTLFDENPDESRLKECLDVSMIQLWNTSLKDSLLKK